jgi:hypothetical protein
LDFRRSGWDQSVEVLQCPAAAAPCHAVPGKTCQLAIRLVMSRSPTSSSACSSRWP